jgi:RNA recognition motif-containing protein
MSEAKGESVASAADGGDRGEKPTRTVRSRSRSRSGERRGSVSGAGGGGDEETRLYVGGLGGSWEISEGDLRDLFSKHGKVANIALKGHYAFVGMQNMQGAKDAIKALHGTIQFSNRRLIVEYTKETKAAASMFLVFVLLFDVEHVFVQARVLEVQQISVSIVARLVIGKHIQSASRFTEWF